MYNEYIKNRFFEESDVSDRDKNILKTLFLKTESYEEIKGKDFYDFTKPEIIDFYKNQNYSSIEYLMNLNVKLKKYINWCLSENLVKDCQNHAMEINTEILFKCINVIKNNISVISRNKLLSMLAIMTNAREKFSIICLFEGIKGKDYSDIIKIKITDFDGLNLNINGKIIQVSQELKDYAIEAENEEYYYAVNSNGKKKFKPSPYVIKDHVSSYKTNTETRRSRNLYVSIVRELSNIGLDYLKPNDFFISGMLNNIKQLMNDYNMDFQTIISSEYIKPVEDRYMKILNKTIFISKYNDIMENL